MKKYSVYVFHLLLLLLIIQIVWILIWNYYAPIISIAALFIPWIFYPVYFKKHEYHYNSFILMALTFGFSIVFSRVFHLIVLYLAKPGINRITFPVALLFYALPSFIFNEYREMKRTYANKLDKGRICLDLVTVLGVLLLAYIFNHTLPEAVIWSPAETPYLERGEELFQ